MSPLSSVVLAVIGGYLAGSIPFGLIFTRMAGLGDIRAIGSGNIGATNVLRTGRKGLAAVTVLSDALKGTLPVLAAARWLGPDPMLAAALGAFLGHVFPVWLGFRGGKGVATFIGALVGVDFRVALAFAGLWLAVAAVGRYSSLSSLVASAVTPALFLWMGEGNSALLFAILAIILWVRHRLNLVRLLAGQEGRIGQRG